MTTSTSEENDDMSKIAKALYEHDEAFAEVADVLFGGGADELIRKLSPDQSDLATKKKRERTQAQVGLASNIVGLAAGTAGLAAASKDVRLSPEQTSSKFANKIYRAGTGFESAARKTKIGDKYYKVAAKPKVAAGLAAGGVGLQGLNLAGDAVANRVLSRASKKPKKKRVKKSHGQLVEISKAPTRRRVKYRDAYRKGKVGAATIGESAEDIRRASKDARIVARRLKRATGVGGVAILGGAAAAGYHEGKHGKLKAKITGKHSLKPLGKKPQIEAKVPTKTNVAVVAADVSQKKAKEFGKSEQFDIEWGGELSKMDTDKRQVFGWASITKLDGEDVIDKQGDYIALDEIEKAAYHYVHNSRKGGDMHQRAGEVPLHKSDMIESFVVTPEKLQKMGLDPDSLPHGWWVGYQVNDQDLWHAVKEGKRVGFSIHGKGVRTPMEV